jgi:hypothetical protein
LNDDYRFVVDLRWSIAQPESLSGQQQLQILALQIADQTFVGRQDGIRELSLALLQLENAFVDGVLRKSIDRRTRAVRPSGGYDQ